MNSRRRDALATPHRASLKRRRRFQAFLDRMFEPGPAVLRLSDPAVTVCRCEEATVAEIEHVIARGCPGPDQAKAFTRCGMGPCQGRMCATVVSGIAKRPRQRMRSGRFATAGAGRYIEDTATSSTPAARLDSAGIGHQDARTFPPRDACTTPPTSHR